MRCSAITTKGTRCKNRSPGETCWIHKKAVQEPEPVKEDCCVCMEAIETKKICLEKCKHNFCHDCITEWLCDHNNCPMCRTEVTALEGSLAKQYCIEKGVITKVVITKFDRSMLSPTDRAVFHFFFLLGLKEINHMEFAEHQYLPDDVFAKLVCELNNNTGPSRRMLQKILETHTSEVKYYKTSTFAEINGGKKPEKTWHWILNDFDQIVL